MEEGQQPVPGNRSKNPTHTLQRPFSVFEFDDPANRQVGDRVEGRIRQFEFTLEAPDL